MKLLKNITTFAQIEYGVRKADLRSIAVNIVPILYKMKKLFAFLFFLPFAAFAQTNPDFAYTPTCFGNQTTLVASSSLQDSMIASWMWDLDGNGSYEYSGKTVISTITINDTVPVKIKITPKTGTADSVTKNVIIDPLPNVNFMANNLCELNAATYISMSSISTGVINQWKWDFNNDGVDDDISNDTVQYVCGPASTYISKLTCVSDKGCAAFTQKTTTVYPNPSASFTSANACEGDSAMFTNTSTVTNLDFYLWNFGDGNNSVSSGNAAHVYANAGTYIVNLIAITKEGCRDTATSGAMVYNNPVANFAQSNVCAGSQSVFTDLSITTDGNLTVWSWNLGDGNTSTSQNPMHTYSASGTYSVTLTVSTNYGCTNTVNQLAFVYALPVVSIIGNDTIPNGGEVQLVANGGNSYLWSTGETTNVITVTQSGTYVVTGTDLNGCSASDSIKIVSANAETVTVSGIILTPNDDGFNDALIINNISEYQDCDLKVYNVWNDEVFSVSGYKNDWKGKSASGADLTAGSYYYVIKCDDKPLLKGNINILR